MAGAKPLTVDPADLAALFGMGLPEAGPRGRPARTAPLSSLDLALLATVVTEPGLHSGAVITDRSRHSTRLYGVGERLRESVTVIEVRERRVVLLNRDRREVLEMGAKRSRRPRAAPAKGIRSAGDHEYVIARAEVEKVRANLAAHSREIRIVPAFQRGVVRGIKVFSIRPGSVFARIGLQNGDLLHQVDGQSLDSLEKALEIATRLETATEVELTIERRGRSVKKTYRLE